MSVCDGSGKFGGLGQANFLFGMHFRLSLCEIYNYACAVKNDTPLICTVGGQSADGFEP